MGSKLVDSVEEPLYLTKFDEMASVAYMKMLWCSRLAASVGADLHLRQAVGVAWQPGSFFYGFSNLSGIFHDSSSWFAFSA